MTAISTFTSKSASLGIEGIIYSLLSDGMAGRLDDGKHPRGRLMGLQKASKAVTPVCDSNTTRLWHLACHEQVYLATMILVKSQGFIDLGTSDVWETVRNETVHGLPILQKANDIMHANPRSFDNHMAAADARLARKMTVAESS